MGLLSALEGLSEHGVDLPTRLTEGLVDVFDLDASCVYNLRPADEAVELEFFHAASRRSGLARDLDRLCREFLDGQARSSLTFDVAAPAVCDRNQVRVLSELGFEPSAAAVYRAALAPAGVGACDQLRVLVCDGPRLLAWVGGFREQPFDDDDRRALERLVPAVLTALRRESLLADAGFLRAGLEVALAAMHNPAWLISASGDIQLMNAGATALLQSEPWVRDILRHKGATHLDPRGEGFECTPVHAPGAPVHYLIVRSGLSAQLDARVTAFARRHALTPRQSQVLSLVVRGRSNKAIAAELGCSLRTVELHVSSILRATACDSRAELAAWSVRA